MQNKLRLRKRSWGERGLDELLNNWTGCVKLSRRRRGAAVRCVWPWSGRDMASESAARSRGPEDGHFLAQTCRPQTCASLACFT